MGMKALIRAILSSLWAEKTASRSDGRSGELADAAILDCLYLTDRGRSKVELQTGWRLRTGITA